MSLMYYELHVHKEPDFPVIFHYDILKGATVEFAAHWHESPEILYITEGSADFYCDKDYITAKKGDTVIINSNDIHYARTSCGVEYYCLIADLQMCAEFGIDIENVRFKSRISSGEMVEKFMKIKSELDSRVKMYKAAVKSAIAELFIDLCRYHAEDDESSVKRHNSVKTDTVKRSIKYIRENSGRNISTAAIADAMGISKYYFCRIFKEITGNTPVEYIQLTRCINAKRLISTGWHTVYEAAALSGFDNGSYFTRTYKKYMGKLPSDDKIG